MSTTGNRVSNAEPEAPPVPAERLPHCCEREEFAVVSSAPRAGPLPELRTYRCRRCGHVETVEIA